MTSPIAINVDLGIGECLKTLDAIEARKHTRREAYTSDLRDDLDSAAQIVGTLDNLFVDLVLGFTRPRLTQDPGLLEAHCDETMRYLSTRELLPRLENVIGRLEAARQRPPWSRKPELMTELMALEADLQKYRSQLGRGSVTGVGQREAWNLMTLWEAARRDDDPDRRALREMAAQVHRNHDFALSDAIHKRLGRVRGLVSADVV